MTVSTLLSPVGAAPCCAAPDIVPLARGCLHKLLVQLPASFPSLTAAHPHAGFRDKASLVRFLGYGLHRALAHLAAGGQQYYVPAQVRGTLS